MTRAVMMGAVTHLWQDLVREAEARTHIELADTQESYLVFTLAGHCRDALLVGRILSLELLDGLAADGRLREERLRDVGDRCLLLAGLFPDQAHRRGLGESYYADLGRLAYAELGLRARSAMASLYAELADAFAWLVSVLRALRTDRWLPAVAVANAQLSDTRRPRASARRIARPREARHGMH